MQSNPEAYTKAYVHLESTRKAFTWLLARDGKDPESFAKVQSSVWPGLYEHWKSQDGDAKFYAVFGAGIEQDVDSPLVAYTALYPPHAGELTFRHLLDEKRGFLTPINRDAYQGPRFTLVVPLTLGEIVPLLGYRSELALIKNPAEFRIRAGQILKKNLPLF